MNFYPFHPGDYMLRTAHLEPLEDLAYRRLLDLYYVSEKALDGTAESIARVIRMRSSVAEVASVLGEFFVEEGGCWSHKHCDEVIAKYREKATIAAENGKKGGRPRKQDQSQSDAEENPGKTQPVISGLPEESGSKTNQEPKPNNQEPKDNPPNPPAGGGEDSSGYPQEFETCWAKYPKRAGGNSKKAAHKAWAARIREGVTAEALDAAVQAYASEMIAKGKVGTEYVKQAATFFGPNEHWREAMQPANVHPIRKGLGPDGKLLPGYFWHEADIDLPIEKRRILSDETHDRASGYRWDYLRSRGLA
ncbi:YdaU family protein [Pseudomonas aeruginosa]|uniref:YdaU family protein n=1 Tax=Pseudomonas aeruginosa TaxID=287 RepID=UPI000BB8E564|nr:YdaU family protein [Pseudomonas aeruginosa]PBW14907.1 hypothetical protein CJU17_30705 [Pseudomonas aeruginosa]PBW25676.1 hypothetical protein CJU16_08370 [Pseudomonas aeruginosa]PBW33070.1 hypothetical protein CJU14_02480 [Pseudomonas aeruginosa]PCA60936.1 hypothetical protein CJU15_10170 [Pseudomonas aeruginosa]HBP1684339.1 YdaU family protein [Pseudomonas aeruginosa]